MILREMCEDASEVGFAPIVMGRAIRVWAAWPVGGRVDRVGVHNFGMCAAELRHATAVAADLSSQARARLAQTISVLVGDWHVGARGDGYRRLSTPEAAVNA